MSTKGINYEAFSGDTPPDTPSNTPPHTPQAQKSLIPQEMLGAKETLGAGIQGQAYGHLNPMQQVIGLTPEQAKFRLQQQELVLRQQELNQRFLFRLLMTVGSITGAVILGALAIFQFSPSNRANAYAKVAERTAESIGRPEIRVDCGFRLMGECDAGQMADRALTTYEQPTQSEDFSASPEGVRDVVQVPAPPMLSSGPSVGRQGLVMAAVVPTAPVAHPSSNSSSNPGANPVTDPRQTDDYRQARDLIHSWSRRGFSSEVVAGHYYWLQAAQTNPSDPEHAKALQQPQYPLFELAFEDYYNLSL